MAFSVSRRLSFITMMMLIIIIPAYSQPQENITINSVIMANDSNSIWKSKSGEFSLCFRRVSSEGYLLAIIFTKMPEKTIVWAANREKLVKPGSWAQLSANAGLQLFDPRGELVWATNLTEQGSVDHGAMLDNGNFVLERNDSFFLWQSFAEPTDTLLPGQVLNQDGSLFASFSDTNTSRGRFKLILQEDGNLVLYTINYPMADPISAYWSTQTSISSGYRLIFNQSGYIYLIAKNGTILNMIFPNLYQDELYRQRLTLDHYGVLKHYVCPRSPNATQGGPMKWQVDAFEPTNICLRVGGTRGSGACGYNSLCSLGQYGNPICRCPEKGYSDVDPTDKMGGCRPDFNGLSCGGSSMGNGSFEFVDVANADWPGSEYEWYGLVSEEWCRKSCEEDLFCAAAVVRNGSCWKMGFPLRNGRVDGSLGGKSMVKIWLERR